MGVLGHAFHPHATVKVTWPAGFSERYLRDSWAIPRSPTLHHRDVELGCRDGVQRNSFAVGGGHFGGPRSNRL